MASKIHNRGSILLLDATDSQLEAIPFSPFRSPFTQTLLRFAARSLLFLCLSFYFLATAWAGVGGSISGTIKDPSGAAIANASVTLVNSSTGARQSAAADAR